MPPIETLGRYEKAVLWPLSGQDNFGEVTLATRVEVTVRWDDTQREALDAQGKTIKIDASVLVDRSIAVGSIMWKGELADLPNPPTNLFQVIGYEETSAINNKFRHREVLLMKYGNTLPALA